MTTTPTPRAFTVSAPIVATLCLDVIVYPEDLDASDLDPFLTESWEDAARDAFHRGAGLPTTFLTFDGPDGPTLTLDVDTDSEQVRVDELSTPETDALVARAEAAEQSHRQREHRRAIVTHQFRMRHVRDALRRHSPWNDTVEDWRTEHEAELASSTGTGPTLHRFLLVEVSNITGLHEFSSHATVEQALHYQAQQECAEDWEPVELVDLDDGSCRSLIREYRTVFD